MQLYIDTTLTVFCTFMFFKRKKKEKRLPAIPEQV